MFFSTAFLAALPLAAFAAPHRPETLYAEALVTGNGIKALVKAEGYTDGRPTKVTFEGFTGLFDTAHGGVGPYLYHFHTNPITPGDTTCNSAFGHLDPTNATEALKCTPGFEQYCQEGDISGKHGRIQGSASGAVPEFSLIDDYVRFFPADFSVLGRSVVIHAANKTRLACGNVISILDGTASANGQPTHKPSTYIKDYPTAPPFTPAVVNDPFVGGRKPTRAELLAMTFPLPNPLLPVDKKNLYVKLVEVEQEAFFDHKEQKVELPKVEVTGKFPLHF